MNAVHGSQMMCLGMQMGNKCQQIAMVKNFHIYSVTRIHSMAISGAAFSAFFCVEDSNGHGGFLIFLSRREQAVRKKWGVPWPQLSHTWRNTELTDWAGHFWWTILHFFRWENLISRPIQFRDFFAYGWYIPMTGIHGKLHVKSMNIPIPLNPNQSNQ